MTISTQRLRFLRGNSAAVAGFTGLQGEVVFNTDTYTLHLQDGVTSGGYSLATSAQVANITANSNYGNSNVTSFLASNSNLAITTTANITTNANFLAEQYVAANAILIGGSTTAQHSLIISSTNGTIKFLTGNRANGNSSIQLQANNSLSGIYIRNDNGSMGFNSIPQGPNVGYNFNFNGSVYGTEFFTDANTPTGYQFTTADTNTGISHIEYGANLSAIRIRHDNVETIKFYNNNTTEIRGNAVISDGSSYGTYPDAYMQIYGNISSYQQIVNQNLSNNAGASTDFVATADNGTDTSYYIDMGINSSQFNHAAWFPAANTANDGYLYVVGSNITGPSTGNIANLIIGSTNGVVKTFVGNTTDANVVTTVSTNLLTVSGNVNANYFIGNGSLLTGITAGTNYSNSNVVSLLASFGSNTIVTSGNITVGNLRTTDDAVVLGDSAGGGNYTVSIGSSAGASNQSDLAIAIGTSAGQYNQAQGGIAIGRDSGYNAQGTNAVALGFEAGNNNQGINAIAVGYRAGYNNQSANSIVINASGTAINGSSSGFFVSPVAANTTGNILYYNTTTKEIVYGAQAATYGNSNVVANLAALGNNPIVTTANVTANVFIGNGSQLTGLSSTAATVDITDTNGLTTTYYPTFVSNRAAGQVVRADVDLSYRTDTNTLTAGKITLTGTGTAVNASSGDILTNQVTGTQINFLSGIYTVSLNASGAAANYTLNLPANAGVNGQVLTTNGSGALSWSTPSSTYGNSNVVSLLSSFGSNIITTTGNIAAGNLNATGANLTGNITGGNLSISGNINGNTAGFALGYRDVPQVLFTSNATLALTDAGKHYYSVNSANIITIPNNTVVAFNIGTAISIVQQGTANLTINPGSGVILYMAGNISSGSRILSNVGMATLLKVDTNTWFINGTGLT